ncbi:MAG: NTP transferase domain-containing protein [Eubacterium sp.]|nr:NTP transferase domain-containing protein [Eubacterium sp.]
MSIIDKDILLTIQSFGFVNQRKLMEQSGYSIGSVNKSINSLIEEGMLDQDNKLTKKGRDYIEERSPKNAVILAAGYGMRMVPINTETPKGLLTVDGVPLIERTIEHLHQVGIKDITMIVGFMMEQYDYLVDKYDINMIYNNDYASKNNLHSLALAADRLDRTYIVPCDIWSENNPFSEKEVYSWYMVSDVLDEDSWIRVNRKAELVKVVDEKKRDDLDKIGNRMIGISYVCGEETEILKNMLLEMDKNPLNDESFWEDAAFRKDRMYLNAKVVDHTKTTEVNTYEQLRELDSESRNLENDAIRVAAEELGVNVSGIKNITVLKKGMTNRSFLFTCKDDKYIMRIPGEGTSKLIDRHMEADVYDAIKGKGICDDNVYLNADNGYKITKFIDNSRNCDPLDQGDIEMCMKKLRDFHDMKLSVPHTFDIFAHIDYYEKLWNGASSVYRDYQDTKEKVLSLKDYIDGQDISMGLAHIDSVPDNFMIIEKSEAAGKNMKKDHIKIQLIDWEYAGMQDRYVDLAMFSIYSMYDKDHVDNLIDTYFAVGGQKTDEDIRTRIYVYISMCGLLWSNWCEYKRGLGVDFGEYSLRQYRYAKDYYKLAKERM